MTGTAKTPESAMSSLHQGLTSRAQERSAPAALPHALRRLRQQMGLRDLPRQPRRLCVGGMWLGKAPGRVVEDAPNLVQLEGQDPGGCG